MLTTGCIDIHRGDNGIVRGRVFLTPCHVYKIVRVDRSHNPMRCADVLVYDEQESPRKFTLEVEAIAGMIIEERMGKPSRLDDVLAKQK